MRREESLLGLRFREGVTLFFDEVSGELRQLHLHTSDLDGEIMQEEHTWINSGKHELIKYKLLVCFGHCLENISVVYSPATGCGSVLE